MKHFSLLAALLWLVGCASDGTGQQPHPSLYNAEDSTLLRVAVTPTIDCLPLYVASDHGLFSQQGVTVVLRHYQAQMDQDTAIERGRADIVTTDLVRAEYMERRGVALQYLTATNLSWQLYANKAADIEQLVQIDDKMVAMTRQSATALLSDAAVDSAGLESERVFRIQVNDVAIRLNMLETGIMDALLLPEPQATAARMMGSRLLLDAQAMDLRLGVMAVRQAVMADSLRRQQVAAFMQAYDQACDSININGVSRYRDLIVRYCGVKSEVVDSLPKDLTFYTVEQPRRQDVERAKRWTNGK